MFEDTPLVMVEDQATLQRVAARLARCNAIGVDTEADSFYAYQEKVCLLQISDDEADYVIDPLALKRDLSPLAPVFANPDIVKIFHGADYDIVSLKRDHGFAFHNLFDSLIAAQLLGLPKFGLADLIERYFGIQLDKAFQRHDWAARPLLPEHLEYARGDTHWLRAIRELMSRKLVTAGKMKPFAEECRILEGRTWQGKGFDPEGWTRVKGSAVLDDEGKRVLRALWAYRDGQARQLDRPTFKVIPDEILLAVATRLPRRTSELDAVIASKSGLRRRHERGLLDAVAAGLVDETPIAVPTREKPTGPKPRLVGRAAERALNELKSWRNGRGGNPNTAAFTVASSGTLKNIALMRPRTLAELAAVADVRAWQVEAFGDEILAVLDRVDPPR